jgi:hypothetical protein
VRFGLGWAINPGILLVWMLVALAGYGLFRGVRLQRIVAMSGCFLAPLFFEFLPVSGVIWAFAGIGSVLVACCFVYRARIELWWKFVGLLLGAYIQAVFIYNLFAALQRMNFFLPGWIS